MQPNNLPSKYRPDIDGLRAIAIISVVFYHAGFPGFPGGFVGVDVFFVISGYLITALLFNEAVNHGHVSLSAFYARRVRRLMPAALLVVAITLLLGGLFLPPASSEQRSLARSAMAMAFFGSNFFFFKNTGGYFDAPSFSLPLLHTWSLSIEEQYYLIWPLLMMLFFRFTKTPQVVEKMRRRVICALGMMLIASLVLCVSTTSKHQSFTFYLLPARVWEFAIGGIIGLVGQSFYTRLRRYAEALALGGLALIIYSVAALSHSTPFPGWAAMFPVFGTALLIVGLNANEHGVARHMLCAKPLVLVGLLSYSWYLWHWPLLSIYRIYNMGAENLLHNALLVALALGLAYLTFIWIERPIRLHRPWLFSHVRSTLFVGLGICLTTVLLASGLWAWRNHQKSLPEYKQIFKARGDLPPYQMSCSPPKNWEHGVLVREECTQGPDKQHPKIILWGDSHADHLMPMMMEAFPNASVSQLTMPGCIPVIGYDSRAAVKSQTCQDFNQRVLREIAELKAKGLEGVVISARWHSYLWHQSISLFEQQSGSITADAEKRALARADMQASLDAMLSSLEKIGVRVAILAPSPELIYPPLQCLALRGDSYCNVPRKINESFITDATSALSDVVSRHSNTRLIQLMDFFCDTETCYAKRNGKILYFDSNHLTATAARELGHHLSSELAWLKTAP